MKIKIWLVVLSGVLSMALQAGVYINEVQSSNDQTCIDESGESGDWIELYNSGNEDVNLGGWGLSDKAKKPFKSMFPTNAVIKAGGYLMVFADGTGEEGGVMRSVVEPEAPAVSVLSPTNDALKANLVCWLRADDLISGGASSGSAVQTWSDASGKGNNASNSTSSQRPKVYPNVVNGHAAVRFTASSSQWLGLTKYGFNGMSDMKNVTVVIVGKWSGGGTSVKSGYSWNATTTTYAGLFDVSQKQVSKRAYDTYFQIKQGGVLQLYTGSSSSTTLSSSGVVTSGKWCSLAFATNSKNQSPKTDLYCDGALAQSFEPSGLNNSTFVSDSGRMAIGNASCKMNEKGSSVSSSGYFFDGDIAEVIIFSRGLTQDEYVKLYNYIDEKYDLSGKGTGGTEEPTVKVRGLHTSYSLSADGETLTLTDAASNRVDQIEFGKIPCDASFGRTPDGGATFKWFAAPTPNGANDSEPYEEPVGGVSFTPERGLYDTNIGVTLKHDDPEATIIYTTDHSDPGVDANGVTNGVVYTGGEIAVSKTTVIRATALKAGHLPWKNITTHSYIYLSGVADQVKPSIAADKWTDDHYCSFCNKIVTGDKAACPACYGISKTFVNDAASRAKLVEALKAAPIVSITMSDEEMFDPDTGLHSHPISLDIDRYASVEWLNGNHVFGTSAGMCMSGGWARQFEITPKKSFRLKFRGRFGTSKLEEPVLDDVGCDHTGFKNLVLRGENNQSWGRYSPKGTSMADQILRDVQGEMSGYHASGSHVQLFINGLYWGLYNVCEYADADWATDIAGWGGVPEDYDVLKHGLSNAEIPGMEVRDGTADAYTNLIKYVQSCASDNNVTQDEYTNICAKVDIDAYIDYIMLQGYIGNQDWPNNNWIGIMSEKAGVPLRYIAWDVEYSLFSTSSDRLKDSSSYSYTSEKIHRTLQNTAEYKLRFADRVHKHFYNGGALTTDSLKARYKTRADWIRKAIFGEVARWGAYYHDNYSSWTFGVHYVELNDGYKTAFSETTWETEYTSVMKFFADRWSSYKTQLKDKKLYPSVEAAEFTTKNEGAEATLSIPSSTTVYYTTDGSDPRVAFTGAISSSAKAYTSGSTISATDADIVVKARAYNTTSTIWSALSEVALKAPPPPDTIKGSYPTGLTLNLEEPMELKVFDATFNGPLKVTGADITLVLQNGATAEIPQIDATGCRVTIDGAGVLEMSGAAKLFACAGLTISNGTLRLTYTGTEAKSMAVELTGSYLQYGGDVTMDLQSTAQVYGFYSNTADIEARIYGGTFTSTIDGGDGTATFKMNKGSNDVKLKGGEISVQLAGTGPRFINTDGKLDIDGAKITVKTLKDANEIPLGTDARVFKSVKTMEISKGLVTGKALGAGSEMFSSDKKIVVSGGVVSVEAADDCFSAAENITVSGGKVHALSTAGDALDSNGNMVISGGYVFAFATGANGEGLDVDPKTGDDNGIAHTLVISGGTVVAVGYDGVMHAPDVGSVNCYTAASMSSSKKYVEVAGAHPDGSKTVTTVNWEGRHANGFSLIATCPDFVGTVTETKNKPDKELPYIEKLDSDIDGVFLTTYAALPIVAEGETEPGMGTVPAGNVSRFDTTQIYDGLHHTLNTNALVDAVSPACQTIDGFSIAYVRGSSTVSAPTEGWTSVAPSFTDAGEYVIWYKASAPGCMDFLHAAKVTIAPYTGVVVTVRGTCATNVYTGAAQIASGYTLESDVALYDADASVSFAGAATATRTNVGTTQMNLADTQFANTNGNFTSVTFRILDGEQTITKATNAWTVNPDVTSKIADGTAASVTFGAAKFGEVVVTYNGLTAAPVKVGSYTATFTVAGTSDYEGLSEDVVFKIISPASSGGKEYETAEEAVQAATSESPVTFEETPVVNNTSHTITPKNGTSIKVADYYDIQLEGKTVTFTLNKAATPEVTSGTSEKGETIPAFVMETDEPNKVGVGTTTREGLFYALEVGESLWDLAVPNGATWIQGTGCVIQLKAPKMGESPSCGFYRVVVKDVIKQSSN